MSPFEPVLTRNAGNPAVFTVEGYRTAGGWAGLDRALAMAPTAITEEVKRSGLRGRGGAGFPAGTKWGFVPADSEAPKYLVCNADESEPGTFKDRYLIENDPHQLIEGCIICCLAVDAHHCYVYIRGEYVHQARILEEAIADAYRAGMLGDSVLGSGFRLDMVVHRGAGAYICGEETGMLESLEGKRGMPRVKPPFPAVAGAFGCPTVINNVETLCNVPHILERGAAWYRSIGTDERNTGPKLYALSGHVEEPGTYELPIGSTLDELLEAAGGMLGGRALKAFVPGGASAPVLTAAERAVPLDFDRLAQAGSMLGSAAVIVMDETTDMLQVAWRFAHFFNHESCGQCTPCREGTNWLDLLFRRLASGHGGEAELDLITSVCRSIGGNSLCALGDAAVGPAASIVERFRGEILERARSARAAADAGD